MQTQAQQQQARRLSLNVSGPVVTPSPLRRSFMLESESEQDSHSNFYPSSYNSPSSKSNSKNNDNTDYSDIITHYYATPSVSFKPHPIHAEQIQQTQKPYRSGQNQQYPTQYPGPYPNQSAQQISSQKSSQQKIKQQNLQQSRHSNNQQVQQQNQIETQTKFNFGFRSRRPSRPSSPFSFSGVSSYSASTASESYSSNMIRIQSEMTSKPMTRLSPSPAAQRTPPHSINSSSSSFYRPTPKFAVEGRVSSRSSGFDSETSSYSYVSRVSQASTNKFDSAMNSRSCAPLTERQANEMYRQQELVGAKKRISNFFHKVFGSHNDKNSKTKNKGATSGRGRGAQ